MDADGFIVVNKKKTATRKYTKPDTNYLDFNEETFEGCIRKIQQAQNELEISKGFSSFQENLNKVKRSLHKNKGDTCQVSSIICYGLGKVSSSRIARYQTALLLCIQKYFCTAVEVFDPAFSPQDEKILSSLNFSIISKNEEGKRTISDATLFYMPHCGKELYNNLLWANWNVKSLPICVIIGNSFSSITQNVPTRLLKQYYQFIERAEDLFEEYPLKLLIEHDDVFNDLSIHVINKEITLSKTEKIFNELYEPNYDGCDMEIVRA